ncbi:MAG: hypothetical protein ACKOPM_13950 [Novosphingobium sp.]
MARQPRKQPQNKPIAQHQLFPAVVALWFGALFGLGSLAVRPSLLESLVIKSRIDLIVPAAAPPLGITARILVALILAAIGSAIGIAIARRLARPKVEMRERKRSKLAVDEAPVRRPFGTSFDSSGDPAIIAPRRRALAIEHEDEQFVPHDMAPLPGGAPQILDISSVGFRSEPVEAPLDLTGFPAPPPAEPAQPSAYTPLPVAAPEPERQVFQPLDPVSQSTVETHHSHPATEAAAAAADGRQVFGMAPVSETIEAPKQIFGQPVEDGRVSEDYVKAVGYQTTVFETPEPSPLFPPRATAVAVEEAVPQAPFAMPQAFEVPPAPVVQPFVVPSAEVPPSSFDIGPQSSMPHAYEPQPAPAAVAAPQAAPWLDEPLPSPAGLGMDDLSARLAASMARRRAARSGTATDVAPPVTPAPEAAASAAPPVEPVAMPEAPVQQFAEPVPQANQTETQLDPVAEQAPPAPFAAPFSAPANPPATPAPAPAIPAAMRPLELNGFEDDAEPLDHLLPPRHIAIRQPASAEAPPIPLGFAPSAEPVEDADAAQADVKEDNYASLLGITPAPARSGFVRIDEHETESAAIEPVVIFPGQIGQPVVPEATPFRPFDAPASAGQGQPVSANPATPAVDREEADRALRMALANLQRMSGAA